MTSTDAQPAEKRGWLQSPFVSFRHRNYRWLWAANVCNGLVQSAQRFAFVWLAFDLSGATSFLGLVALMVSLPALLLTLPAGVLTDRTNRRLLLASSHVLVAFALVLTAVLSETQMVSTSLLLVTAFLVGIGVGVGEPVRAALVPAIVPKSRLLNANALYALAQGAGAVVGPALAGATIALWGVSSAFVVLAGVMLAGALFLIPLRVPPREPLPSTAEGETVPRPQSRPGMWGSIAEGFGFIFSGTTVVGSLFLLLLVTALGGPWLATNYANLVNDLDISSQTASGLFALMGATSLASLFVIASIPRLRNAGGWYAALGAAGALLTVGISSSSNLGLTALLMVPYGLVVGVSGIIFLTLVQSVTPITLMGRVMAIQSVVLALGAAVGGLVVAIDREAVQSDAGVIAAGVVIAVVAVAIVVRNPRLRRMPSHPETRVAAPAESGPG